MNHALINQSDSAYPYLLKKHLADKAPETITAIDNPDILQNRTLGRLIGHCVDLQNRTPVNI